MKTYHRHYLPLLFKSILMFLLLIVLCTNVDAQDTTESYLYVRLMHEDTKPDPLDSTRSQNEDLNDIFDSFGVFLYEQSFPGAKRADVSSIYHIYCSGNKDSLKTELENIGLFDTVEKAYYYIAGCTNPHPPVDDYIIANNIRNNYALEMIEANCAWSITTGNPDVIVGVVDTEFDTEHPDLQGKIVSILDPDPSITSVVHGTRVIGCMTANTHNGIGIASIGYKTKVVGYRVPTTTGFGNPWPAIWSAYLNGEKIINISWYGDIGPAAQIEEMTENGTVLVFCAGNDNNDEYHKHYADIPGVIIVSGVAADNKHGSTPNQAHNQFVDLCAPSVNVTTTQLHNVGDGYGSSTGTSIAAPLVSGTISLMLSVNPCLSPAEIEEILKATADPIDDAHLFPGQLGAGRLNAYRAVEMALEYTCMEITKVGINTKCRPGESTNSIDPKLVPVIANGTPPYTYRWDPIMDGDPNGNNTELDDYEIAEPTIITSSNNHLAYYQLTVTDASTIQKRATHIVRIQLQSAGYDLAMRDSDVDMLDEPNMQASLDPTQWNIWLSPDVWNQLDDSYVTGHQNPLYSTTDPNYAYVRVKNVGCAPSPANVPLKLYWALASTGEEWPRDWLGNSTVGPNNEVGGGIITTTPLYIPSLDPGQEHVDNHEWYPPDPQLYDPRVHTLDVCLLARIEEDVTPPYGMTFPEGRSTTENVRSNNNIVTRNMNMYNLGRTGSSQVVVGNTGINERAFSIEFITEQALRGVYANGLADYLDATIYLGEDLYDIWQNGGGLGNFIPGSAEQYTVKWDPSTSFRLDNIVLDTAVRFPIRIKLHAKYDTEIPDSVIGQLVHFRQLILDTLGGYEVYGNVTFSIDFRPNDPAPKGVLFVTEIGNGPSATNCEYIEIMVANCGNDQSDFVDIRGWILDDDGGNFGTGIGGGHYRLSYDSLWAKVPVGSILAIYNSADNCYQLPTSFMIDTTMEGYPVYWIPASTGYDTANTHLDIAWTYPVSWANGLYCGSIHYPYLEYNTLVYYWPVVGLDDGADAFQVRCPGCTYEDYHEPPFYHGIGYGMSSSNSIPPDYASLGGPVIPGSGSGYRYIFGGSTEADLGDTSAWIRMISQPGGSPVGTLGYVGAFHQKVLDRELNLPCCGAMPPLRRAPEQEDGAAEDNNMVVPQKVSVYPNPASDELYFLFPPGDVIIKLTDISGRTADVQMINGNSKAIFNVRHYTPGIYLYQIVTNDEIYTGRVLIGD